MKNLNIKVKIIPILQKYGVKKAAIFGSYAKGTDNKKSDLDILVQPPKGMSLLDFAGMQLDIEDNLHLKVDLVSYNGINPYLKDKILSEQKIIYEV